MSFIPVLEYMIGIALFGFVYWLLDGIRETIEVISLRGDTYDFLMYVWVGSLLIYLIFGGIWLIRTYTEQKYMEG